MCKRKEEEAGRQEVMFYVEMGERFIIAQQVHTNFEDPNGSNPSS